MPIRLVVVDDHRCLIETLESLLRREPDIHLVARCQSGEETLDAVHQHRPDVVLLALRPPGTHGLEVLRAMRQAKLPTRVVLLTDALPDDALLEAILLGVGGIVAQETRPSPALVACIRKVYAGDQWFPCGIVGGAVETLLRREVVAREQSCTLRHQAVADPGQGRGRAHGPSAPG